MLHPLLSSSSYKSTVPSVSIVLRFVFEKTDDLDVKISDLQTKLLSPISPIFDAILSHEVGASPKQTLGAHLIEKVVSKYKEVRYREIIYFMRDLKAKNVFNFSRSGLYSRLAKSKLIFDLKS